MLSKKSHRNNKQLYYSLNFLKLFIPNFFYRNSLKKNLNEINKYDIDYIKKRVNYYNKIDRDINLHKNIPRLAKLKIKNFHKTYFFDSYEFTRYFNPSLKMNFLFGDITNVPDVPSIVKSRPIMDNHKNSVLFKLNKVRHFTYTNDSNKFYNKKNMLIGRGAITKKHKKRADFYKMYFDHKLCDLGQINNNTDHDHWIKNKISIEDHLKYKFIMCIEGVDVATNLKWVMSSNSIAVMTKPKIESWFMEKQLIANYHYIEIKDDYSDLEEKLTYYINNVDECLKITKNANKYVNQFRDTNREKLISLLVLEKYFIKTLQIPKRINLLY
ncbi:MAG TPA: glycosyl transferase family 90 [Flavobacteriaceae bacterium]|nr:glycosyl transferase family 90 [Flavobacteriaceae bacterium]